IVNGAPLPDGTPFHPYETALVETPVPFTSTAGDTRNEVAVCLYKPDHVAVQARAPGGGFLVLGDSFYPGWKATVDGQPARMYLTDYVLRGVLVPPGDHLVEFRFRPAMFYLGLCLSGLSAVLLIGFRRRWLSHIILLSKPRRKVLRNQ
ncbi:MAG: YfhO family protein, partial [Planctomycetes bacterium]|nr:YfhO family protein [Planctomycetota bacterium]